MHKLLFIIAFVLAAYGIARGQDFSYTVSTDSVAWNELSSQTVLNTSNSAWNFSYRVPIGFTFNYLGRPFDSLTIETNGYLVFDRDRKYAITAFSGVGDHIDSVGNHAMIGYELTGTAGSRILKIQYKNCGPSACGNKMQSWQVWLKENGNVEVRVGPGTLRMNTRTNMMFDEQMEQMSTVTTTELDTTQKFRIGFLNMNMNTEERGLFIGNNPVSPQTRAVNDSNPNTILMNCIPARGYRYTFTPSN